MIACRKGEFNGPVFHENPGLVGMPFLFSRITGTHTGKSKTHSVNLTSGKDTVSGLEITDKFRTTDVFRVGFKKGASADAAYSKGTQFIAKMAVTVQIPVITVKKEGLGTD